MRLHFPAIVFLIHLHVDGLWSCSSTLFFLLGKYKAHPRHCNQNLKKKLALHSESHCLFSSVLYVCVVTVGFFLLLVASFVYLCISLKWGSVYCWSLVCRLLLLLLLLVLVLLQSLQTVWREVLDCSAHF